MGTDLLEVQEYSDLLRLVARLDAEGFTRLEALPEEVYRGRYVLYTEPVLKYAVRLKKLPNPKVE